MRKKKKAESEHEVDYETAVVEKYEIPTQNVGTYKTSADTFDADYCWCGKRVPGCNGNPTRVVKLDAKNQMFVCPYGRDETSVKPKLFDLARKAGLVS